MDTAQLVTTLWVIGISAESVTAALAAGRQKMDWFGVVTLAALTALGGGTIRDVVLDNYPLVWVDEPMYLVLCIVVALITTQIAFIARYFNRVFLIGDALGLASFAVLGTQIALELGHGFVIAAVAAVLTGVSGGVMRDVLSDRVPLVFTQDLYASIAVATAGVYMLGLWAGIPEEWVIVVSLLFAFISRVATMDSNRGLPVFEYSDDAPMDPRLRLSAQFLKRSVRNARDRANRFRREVEKYRLLGRTRRKKDPDEEQKWPPRSDSS